MNAGLISVMCTQPLKLFAKLITISNSNTSSTTPNNKTPFESFLNVRLTTLISVETGEKVSFLVNDFRLLTGSLFFLRSLAFALPEEPST